MCKEIMFWTLKNQFPNLKKVCYFNSFRIWNYVTSYLIWNYEISYSIWNYDTTYMY